MRKYILCPLFFLLVSALAAQRPYFPPAGKWAHKSPVEMGIDTAHLNAAILFAIEKESRNPRSMAENHKLSFGKEPHGEAVGPFKDRGDATGIIVYKGYIVAEWGEPGRVDMTHSVTKSFLSTTVGLAIDKGIIKSSSDLVSAYISEVPWLDSFGINASVKMIHPFNNAHNKTITWETMLRQTSDWEGDLWTKYDWADRPDRDSSKWHNRPRNVPGAVFEYNDVRVNAMALAATWVWKKPLPDILKKYIMNPIGASATWQWNGYSTSWIQIKNKPVLSVSGGGHWGGGMFINAYDMARFGLFTLHRGNWNGTQLLSEHWFRQATTPTTANNGYGYMNYFLNTDRKLIPAAPESAYMHVGNGTNIVYVDTENDLVMVVRWIENNAIPEFVKKALLALPKK